MIRMIIAALLVIWLIGIFFHLLGGLIHIALIIAAILFIYDVFARQKHA